MGVYGTLTAWGANGSAQSFIFGCRCGKQAAEAFPVVWQTISPTCRDLGRAEFGQGILKSQESALLWSQIYAPNLSRGENTLLEATDFNQRKVNSEKTKQFNKTDR